MQTKRQSGEAGSTGESGLDGLPNDDSEFPGFDAQGANEVWKAISSEFLSRPVEGDVDKSKWKLVLFNHRDNSPNEGEFLGSSRS